MIYIVDLYNNAPHDTLSKFACQLVSPNEVDSKPELEEFIVRRIQQENFNISFRATAQRESFATIYRHARTL